MNRWLWFLPFALALAWCGRDGVRAQTPAWVTFRHDYWGWWAIDTRFNRERIIGYDHDLAALKRRIEQRTKPR